MNARRTSARLETRGGSFVVSIVMPPMKPQPEIICWGSRFFVLHVLSDGPGGDALSVYREAVLWVAPPVAWKGDAA